MFQLNSEFGKKGMFRWENRTSVGWKIDPNNIFPQSSDLTHDLPHTVASNTVKVSHALNHSVTEAVWIVIELSSGHPVIF